MRRYKERKKAIVKQAKVKSYAPTVTEEREPTVHVQCTLYLHGTECTSL